VAILAGLAAVALASPAQAANLDDGGTTPVAREGSELAARGTLSKSGLRARLQREMNRVGGASGAWVYDLSAGGGGSTLFSDSGKRSRILASNAKLFTTAAFLDRFGPDGTLRTGLWTRGNRTGPNDRKLQGDLALVGDGDPALAAPGFARRRNLPLTRLKPLAKSVRAAGIRRVTDDLIVDPTVFDRKRSVPQPGITGGPYLSTLSGLSYNAGISRQPERDAGRALLAALRRAGVKVKGEVRVKGTPAKLRSDPPLDFAKSPAAAKLIARTNTPSDNFYAEMLLKRLAARGQRPGTTARGAQKAERFANRSGSGASLTNGSGLSRKSRSSPKQLGKLLAHMAGDEALDGAYRDSLAVAGRTGTLSNRMRGTAAEGRCQAKTGTITGVTALSGYCKSGSGLIAFSILMNGVNVDAGRRAQDAMAAAIARYG
jgi:D-alanyl-D-alanine carboxypeptidase/D-alanyl-D-alanine-endopeptidase (penicillin-binding protein 4)